MLRSLDIAKITSSAKALADLQKGSQFQTDAEIEDRIKEVFDHLYLKIADENQGFYQAEVIINSDDQARLMFPDDMYKIRQIDYQSGGEFWYALRRSHLPEAAEAEGINLLSYYYGGYIPAGTIYVLFPTYAQLYPRDYAKGKPYRLTYAKDPNVLLSDPENKLPAGMEHYLAYQVAYLLGVIQQNPNQELGQMAQGYMKSCLEWASQRDTSPQCVQDVDGLLPFEVY